MNFNPDEVSYDTFPPELLNDKNRTLTRSVKEKESDLATKEKELEEQKSRANILQDHLKNVQTEVFNTQRLVEAKTREIESEEHLKMLSERELGRLRVDLAKLEKEATEIQEKSNLVQNAIFRANEKMDAFKTQMQWNADELDQWALAERQKEEDRLQLEKYRRADEAKIKEMNMAIEKLARQVLERRRDLEGEVTETQAKQIELDKTADDFRKLQKERQHLVQQWEDTIEVMKQRDESIKEASERFAQGNQTIREKQELLAEKASFLEIEQQNNREVEAKLTIADKTVGRLRMDYSAIQQDIRELEDEIEVIKNTLSKASTELATKRNQNASLRAELAAKQEKLQRVQVESDKTKQRLESEFKLADDLEKKSKQVDDILRGTEQRLHDANKRLDDLKSEQYKRAQELFSLRQQEANYIAEISGATAQSRNMQSKISQLDAQAFKQQELLYNIEFQIQQMERKVSRAQGERTEEEKAALRVRIDELQVVINAQLEQFTSLTTQVKRVHEEVRSTRQTVDDQKKAKGGYEERILQLTIENESIASELKALVRRKEEMLVQHDVLKLQIKRLRDLLHSRVDEVIGLENRKFQLKSTLLEKEEQIKVYRDTLVAELRSAEEERRRIASELRERQIQVEKLRRKFEILLQRLKPEEGEEEMTQAQFIIRAAQEREELQKHGDELDAEIQRLEKEEKALEKTLRLLKVHNVEYQGTFKKADTGDEDYQKKVQLEQKSKEMTSMVNRRTADMREYMAAAQQKQEELQDVDRERSELERQLRGVNDIRTQAAKEVADQREKIEIQQKQLTKLMRDHRRKKGADTETAEEKDFMVQEMRERNKNALFNLQSLVEAHPEMYAPFQRLLAEYELQLPSRPPSGSRLYERPGSTASRSVASFESGRMSARSSASRSTTSSTGSAAGGGIRRPPSVKSVEIKL